MDNRFTRKEEICPIAGDLCNEEHKNCSICISQEEAYQEELCRRECEMQAMFESSSIREDKK